MQSLHILLVDDNLEFLELVTRFLTMQHELRIVGCATSGCVAVEQVATLRPDLVLMDLSMPQMNGLAATHRIKRTPAAPRVVLMTLHDLEQYREATRRVKADGFISKSAIGSQLLPMLASLFPDRTLQ